MTTEKFKIRVYYEDEYAPQNVTTVEISCIKTNDILSQVINTLERIREE